MELKREFFQDRGFIDTRRCTAQEILSHKPWNIPHETCQMPESCSHKDLPRGLQEIMNFFGVLGLLVKRKALGLELVRSVFGFWIQSYYICTENYILRTRQFNPNLWGDFADLYSRMFPDGANSGMSKGEIEAYRERFLALDATTTFTPAGGAPAAANEGLVRP
jgi:hypothetical protein